LIISLNISIVSYNYSSHQKIIRLIHYIALITANKRKDSSSMKEIIHLHIGQAGIQLASACWELFCLECGVAPDGNMRSYTPTKGLDTFFEESSTGKYTSRSVCLDLDSESVDEVSRGIHR